jgi:hypothetical protein
MALAIGNACLAASHDPSKAYGQVMMLLVVMALSVVVGWHINQKLKLASS